MGNDQTPTPKKRVPLRHRLAHAAVHSAGHVTALIALHLTAIEVIGIIDKVWFLVH